MARVLLTMVFEDAVQMHDTIWISGDSPIMRPETFYHLTRLRPRRVVYRDQRRAIASLRKLSLEISPAIIS